MADDPKRSSKAAASAYLERALQINPLFQGDAVISLRTKALGLERPTRSAEAGDDAAERRAKTMAELEELRKACWTAPPGDLIHSLNQLPVENMPDVAAAVERLKTVARNRPRLPELSEHKNFDGDFFNCLKQVLAASPRETNVLREQVLASFRNGKLRKRGFRMIKLVKRELPDLYALEQPWFESLLQQKQNRSAGPGSFESTVGSPDSSFSVPWWMIWIFVVIALRLLRLAFGDS